MRNWRVSIIKRVSLNSYGVNDEERDSVVLSEHSQALGLAGMLLVKGYAVAVESERHLHPTHKNTHAALSFLEVKQMNLELTEAS